MKSIGILASVLLLLSTASCNREEVASASGKSSLALMMKSDQRIAPGETDDVLVTITRDGFEGAVDIGFSGLPAGVRAITTGPIPRGDAAKTYELRADATAPAAEAVEVTVTAKGGGLTVRESFELTVEESN
ncbi:MAG: hypothetical protein ACF8XB_10370 [Planctomycetota bacterium JB042]